MIRVTVPLFADAVTPIIAFPDHEPPTLTLLVGDGDLVLKVPTGTTREDALHAIEHLALMLDAWSDDIDDYYAEGECVHEGA